MVTRDQTKSDIIKSYPPLIENPKDGYPMVLIPEGEFIMGSDPQKDPQAYDDEKPQFKLTIPAYYMGLYTVTNAQYQKFRTETGYKEGGGNRLIEKKYANHPVVEVSWEDAQVYARWSGLRLPTEPEWEKAARGTDGCIYAWGDTWKELICRYSGNKGNETTCAVWDYPEGISPNGIYNMCGNVWEWCKDWYDSAAYMRYAKEGYMPPKTASGRVARGGSWGLGAGWCRAAIRYGWYVRFRNVIIGFRLARSLS